MRFVPEQLLAEARGATGLDDVGDDTFVEPLDILCRALDDEARLHDAGRAATHAFLVRLLAGRLHLVAYANADPGVRDEQIAEPVVVTGAPRSGTTILFGLLSLDPSLRSPLGWELLYPVPPPDAVGRAERELRFMAETTGTLDAIHVYGALQPKECLSAMSFDFRSEEFTARYRVPTYDEWLRSADMQPAYDWHRLVLQVLQHRQPTGRWLLKSPVHLHNLDVLIATYPDARVAVTHRDPSAVLASLVSLVATLRRAFSDHVDEADIARVETGRWAATLDRLVDRADPQLAHSRYVDFDAEPLATVRSVYERLGLPWTDDLAGAMAAHLAAHPKGHAGAHEYHPAPPDPRFARYSEAFGTK